MKVLITLPVKIGFDGMTKQVLSYGRYMDKSDTEVDLISCRGFDPKMKDEVDHAGFAHVYRLEYRDTNQIKYFYELSKIIRKRKYDVIHVNGQSATMAIEMLAALMNGCKVRIAHSHNSSCQHQKAHKLLLPLFNMTYNDAIACSKEAGDWLFADHKYWILNNGVDVDHFSFNQEIRTQIREKLNLKDSDIAVGNVAAFEPKKNHAFLLRVFVKLKEKNPNYKLFLWGIDGTTKDSILEEIEKLDLKETVIYMGTTDRMNDYLNGMDLMLLPSLFEGFPVTAVEWQANGLPCLLSSSITKEANITGLVDFLPLENGEEVWMEKILEYKNDITGRNNDWKEIMKKSGYDIRKNANDLKVHYIEKLNNLETDRGGYSNIK